MNVHSRSVRDRLPAGSTSVTSDGAGNCVGALPNICCIVSILWALGAYSLAFNGANGWIGDLSGALLANLAPVRQGTTVPEVVYVMF